MKRLLTLTFVFALTLSHSAFAGPDAFYPEVDSIVYSEQFWADVAFKDGDNTGITSFRMIYEKPIKQVYEHLMNIPSLKHLHDSYADSRTLTEMLAKKVIDDKPKNPKGVEEIVGNNKITWQHNRRSNKKWTDYWYFRFNLPWPLNDKWVIKKAKVDESEASKGYYRVEYEMKHGNMKSLKGWWELVQVPGKPGWTEFRGRTESNPGLPIPRFLARSTFKSSLKKEFKTNRKIFAASKAP